MDLKALNYFIIFFPIKPLLPNNFKVIFIMATESSITFKVMNQDFIKLDQFDRTNFTHQKAKIMFF